MAFYPYYKTLTQRNNMTTLKDLIRDDIYNELISAPEETPREEIAKILLDEITLTIKEYMLKITQ